MNFLLDSQSTDSTVKVLTEAKDMSGEKKYFIEGIFAQSEKQNRNNRIYSKPVLEKAVAAYQPMIEARRALGELNHPPHPNVNPERASHLIEKLVWEGNNVMGRAKILTTLPMGKIAKGLIDEGVSFGVSTRGMGSISEKNGVKLVQDDFVLNTIDLVSDPSGIDCWVEGIMEGKEWVFDASSGNWVIAETMQKTIKAMSAKNLQEQKLRLFSTFLNQIK
jgi:hypothetical protein